MPALNPPPDEPFYQPPTPAIDLRGMLRRRIVATALGQLRAAAAERERLRTPSAWQAYSAEIRGRFRAAVDHPALRRNPQWRERPRNQRDYGEFGVENLLVESLPGSWMNLTVWKPDPRRFPPPWPAVVTPVGHNGKYHPSEQHPPQIFAANGFLGVSFDPPGFGEKARGNNHFDDGVRGYVVGQNPLAFFLADARRAVDYVLSRTDVDGRGGVAMTGVSGGGFTSIGCALLDARLSVIAPSCFGLSDNVHPIRNGYAGCPETLWQDRYADHLGLENLLIGARFMPLLLMAGRKDTVLTAVHLKNLTAPVRAAYVGAGCAERFKVFVDDCGHEYSVAQALAVVAWMGRWRNPARLATPREPRRLRLLAEAELQGKPPFGLSMATAAAKAARARRTVGDAAVARRGLAGLIPRWAESRRRGLRARSVPRSEMQLWVHRFQEFALRDGPAWELPATALRPSRRGAGVLVFLDDRGRWAALHQWGWLNRAAGLFGHDRTALSVLTVDLPGWGDTRPMPSPFDVVGWGGVDRWTGYLSAATGESVMAMRVRDAVRVVDFVQRKWKTPASNIILGGHGLGATVAGLASCLHGRLGGVLLIEPLSTFAELATTSKSIWPHDAYFPGILGAADLPEALELQPAPVMMVGPRDGQGRLLGPIARRVFRGNRMTVFPDRFDPDRETDVLHWLQTRGKA